jgi:transaldolase
MGASFRNIGEIENLAGCDKLTISPDLLSELAADEGELPRLLTPTNNTVEGDKIIINEASFRWAMNEDPMATEKLADGVRRFAADQRLLEQQLKELL